MAEENNTSESHEKGHQHLELPEYDIGRQSTIYKLTLSMKRRFSPQVVGAQTPSPEGAGEVRDLLRRLVEIDNESRKLLVKVFSLLEKDESLESYVKKRIEDPKVSRMWLLVEQVLACQEGDTNFNQVIMGDDNSIEDGNYTTYDVKSIKEKDEIGEEKRNERFKVRNITSGHQPVPGVTTITANGK
ncbi:hypothetical protein SOVF_074060 [Spinacia oleracea]|nr:hypothetical protein SOVF_074060 [Spinacia oleracea]